MTRRPRVMPDLEEIATKHGLTLADLEGPRGVVSTVEARREAMWALWRGGFTTPEIGKIMKRHATTVAHYLRTDAGLDHGGGGEDGEAAGSQTGVHRAQRPVAMRD